MNTSTPSTRVAQVNEEDILADAAFRSDLQNLADREGLEFDAALQRASTCLEELAVRPEDRYLNWVARLAQFMYSRSYDSELDVNTEQLEQLKAQSGSRPMVFLWSHKSHLDSFVFMRTMYDSGYTPQPLSFAGINMNFVGFGTLAKRSGAIFVRRSFSDDTVYKLVFRHFIDYLVRKRLPLSWSIEGTRSRTGKLMPPKLGLINWVVDAYRRSACEDALLVPVSISFDQIPEIDDYIAMQRGLPKRKESLKWFIDYIGGMKSHFGKIYVRFAEPIAINEVFSVSNAVSPALLGDSSRPGRVQTQKLAFEVSSRIEHATPIKSTDLITLVLLAANGRGLTAESIGQQADRIMQWVDRRKLPTAGNIHLNRENTLELALANLVVTGLLECDDQAKKECFSIKEGQQLAAAYYRNSIIHYFVSSAIAEVAQCICEQDTLDAALALRDLLKFEFFFKAKPAFLADVQAFLEIRGNEPPLFGHAVLRSFIEAYSVLAWYLLSNDRSFSEDADATLAKSALELGESLLHQGDICSETALSLPILQNAIRLARNRGLLEGQADSMRRKRKRFAAEMDQALTAINQLQESYDKQLEKPA